jgi:hypothetical protein
MDTYTIPLTNTFFLLTSGATVTWAHHALVARAKKQTLLALLCTLILAILFTSLQGLEYIEASFNISDGIYGSCFYMVTGFHGFHVFVGTIALLVSFIRIVFNHSTNHHHFGFESAIWYWHFVDVVWLFLFINVYWWSNSTTPNLVYSTLLTEVVSLQNFYENIFYILFIFLIFIIFVFRKKFKNFLANFYIKFFVCVINHRVSPAPYINFTGIFGLVVAKTIITNFSPFLLLEKSVLLISFPFISYYCLTLFTKKCFRRSFNFSRFRRGKTRVSRGNKKF